MTVSGTRATVRAADRVSIVRDVAIVVASVLALYLVYLLRTPIGWLILAAFIATAASAPMNVISRQITRGAAIAVVYLGIVVDPGRDRRGARAAGGRADGEARQQPAGVRHDLNKAIQKNEQLSKLNEDYDITAKLDDLANDLVASSATPRARSSTSARASSARCSPVVTILVMSMFMVARGSSGATRSCDYATAAQAEAIRRASDRIADARRLLCRRCAGPGHGRGHRRVADAR